MTAFSASGVITLSSDREAGNEEESGRERCTGRRREKETRRNSYMHTTESTNEITDSEVCHVSLEAN